MTLYNRTRAASLVVAICVAATFGWCPSHIKAIADEALEQEATIIEAEDSSNDEENPLPDGSSPVDEGSSRAIEAEGSFDDDYSGMIAQGDNDIVESGVVGTCSWTLDSDGRLYVFPADGVEGELWGPCRWSGLTTESVTSISFSPGVRAGTSLMSLFARPTPPDAYMFPNVISIDLSNLDTGQTTDMSGLFAGCSSLREVNLSGIDTSNVTSMYGMFEGCNSLESVDLSSFDTSRVTDMSSMFNGCSSLTSLDLSPLDTSCVTGMNGMFDGCSSLISLDLSPLDTDEVMGMNTMFFGCRSLKSLDLSPLDTSNVIGMRMMFSFCTSLGELDLSDFDTSNVTDMNYMFNSCSSLTSLDLSSFDTSNVTDMVGMFDSCSSLTSLDLSSFDTSNVTDMSYMFNSCSSIRELDISTFDTGSITSPRGMNYMFNCTTLDTFIVGEGWTPAGNSISFFPSSSANNNGSWWSCTDCRWYDYTTLRYRGGIADMYSSKVDISFIDFEQIVDQVWPGAAPTPVPVAKYQDEDLRNGSAFTVSYHGNDCVGVATATIEGIGRCRGTKLLQFNVIPADISGASITIECHQWTGTEVTPKPQVTWGEGVLLEEGTDYELSYSDNVDIGLASVTAVGKGNYSGSCTALFEVIPADISEAAISTADQTYSGSAIEPSVEVTIGSVTLTEGTDYELTYANNTDAGTATVTATGMGNYSGSASATFEITPVDLSSATVAIPTQAWTGKVIAPKATVTLSGVTLADGTDYELSFSDNVDPGTSTVTVTGKGNYTGTAIATFIIGPKTGTWKKSGARWWYQYKDGTYPKSEIVEIDGAKYGFDSSGWMQVGWAKHDGQWYYFASSGKMSTGWVRSGSSWYYMNRDTGIMHTGWLDDGGARYYLRASGVMATGWLEVGGKWYYFASSGKMATGWVKSGSSWYFMDRSTGVMATGWLDDGGKTYWLKSGGAMATGWQKVGGKWYYFGSGGSMARSKWVQKWYYVDADGVMMESGITPDGYRIVNGKWDGKGKVA